MAGSDRALGLALLVALGAACSWPTTRAESAVSLSKLANGCDLGSMDFCEWLGNDAALAGDVARADRAYRRACSGGAAAACGHLYVLAQSLSPEGRAGALDLACREGVVDACETLVAEAEADATGARRKAAVLWLEAACERGDDGASCARLGMVLDSGTFGGERVLAEPDPGWAVDLYARVCDAAFSRHRWEPRGSHATPALATAAAALELRSCELLGDHRASGSGVPRDPMAAVEAYRRCSSRLLESPACSRKRAELKVDPAVLAYDEQQAAAEDATYREEEAEHQRELAEKKAREEQEEADARAAADAQAANNAAAMAAMAQGLGAVQQGLATKTPVRSTVAPVGGKGVAAGAGVRAAAAPVSRGPSSYRATSYRATSYRSASVPARAAAAPRAPIAATPGPADAQRQANLAACLATAPNCAYGCAPAVPYGDPFGARRQIQSANLAAKMCSVDIFGWADRCYKPKIQQTLDFADLPALAQKADAVARRAAALPEGARAGIPACSIDAEQVRQVRFWCANKREDCITQTDTAFAVLECARRTDEFLWHAEPEARRLKWTLDHEAQCHAMFGY